MYICICTHTYIYIERERERESTWREEEEERAEEGGDCKETDIFLVSERDNSVGTWDCTELITGSDYKAIYIYIYIYFK